MIFDEVYSKLRVSKRRCLGGADPAAKEGVYDRIEMLVEDLLRKRRPVSQTAYQEKVQALMMLYAHRRMTDESLAGYRYAAAVLGRLRSAANSVDIEEWCDRVDEALQILEEASVADFDSCEVEEFVTGDQVARAFGRASWDSFRKTKIVRNLPPVRHRRAPSESGGVHRVHRKRAGWLLKDLVGHVPEEVLSKLRSHER